MESRRQTKAWSRHAARALPLSLALSALVSIAWRGESGSQAPEEPEPATPGSEAPAGANSSAGGASQAAMARLVQQEVSPVAPSRALCADPLPAKPETSEPAALRRGEPATPCPRDVLQALETRLRAGAPRTGGPRPLAELDAAPRDESEWADLREHLDWADRALLGRELCPRLAATLGSDDAERQDLLAELRRRAPDLAQGLR